MMPTYPEWIVYDWHECPACGNGLLVEVRSNLDGTIRRHAHCYQCGHEETGTVPRRVDR